MTDPQRSNRLDKTPDSFVRANPPTAGKTTEVIAELKTLQRVVSISANAEEAAALIKQGFRSARDIVDTPREDFVSEHPADDCLTVAEMTYERAQATLIAGEVGHSGPYRWEGPGESNGERTRRRPGAWSSGWPGAGHPRRFSLVGDRKCERPEGFR